MHLMGGHPALTKKVVEGLLSADVVTTGAVSVASVRLMRLLGGNSYTSRFSLSESATKFIIVSRSLSKFWRSTRIPEGAPRAFWAAQTQKFCYLCLSSSKILPELCWESPGHYSSGCMTNLKTLVLTNGTRTSASGRPKIPNFHKYYKMMSTSHNFNLRKFKNKIFEVSKTSKFQILARIFESCSTAQLYDKLQIPARQHELPY